MKNIFIFLALAASAFSQVKVSELPAASTLGGTEVFPTVQSATTKKATAAQIAAYATSVAAATLAPKASPTFTGTVTIPSGASIADYLTSAAADSAYQPLDGDLTSIAALTTASYGRSVLETADAAALRTLAGLGTLATQSATLSDYLTTATAASTYAPLASPNFSGIVTLSGGSNAVRVDSAGTYTGLIQNGLNTNKNGFTYTFRWPSTVTGNYIVTLPNATGDIALVSGALGTPSSITLTNATGLPIATGISGLGTGIATALAVNVGTAGAPVVNGGALGTPSSGTGTNITGIPPANVSGTAAILAGNTFTGAQTITNATAATNKTSGALIVTGGIGVSGTAHLNTVYGYGIDQLGDGIFLVNNVNGNNGAGLGIQIWNNWCLHWRTTNSVGLYCELADTLEIRGGTRSQAVRVYNTYTNATSMEAIALEWSGNVARIGTIKGSIGGSAREMILMSDSVERARISASGITIGASGAPIAAVLSAVATKDFDLTAVVVEDLTMTVTGAAVGDVVSLGVPTGSVTTTAQFSAWVSAADTVTIRCRTDAAGENPASGSFRATVIKH